jgi:hypothetical protein
MASQKVDGAKIDEAMDWAKKQERLIEDDYYNGYPALRNLTFERLNSACTHTARVANR